MKIQRELFYSVLETVSVIIRLNSRYCFLIVDFRQKNSHWIQAFCQYQNRKDFFWNHILIQSVEAGAVLICESSISTSGYTKW